MKPVIFITGLAVALHALPGLAFCYGEAAQRYGVHESLLQAIAIVESGQRSQAVGKNKNGSVDLGVMQINSGWLGSLSKYGITRDHLLDDPCLNVHVGAWILAQNVASKGYNWEAVGAYNAGCKKLSRLACSKLRNRYANKIYAAMQPRAQVKTVRADSKKTSERVAQKASEIDRGSAMTGISSIHFGKGKT